MNLSKKIDDSLLIVGAVLISISCYQLFFRDEAKFKNEKSVGSLAFTQAVVKLKNSMGLDWRDAHVGNDIFENQLIYTDSQSLAHINLNKGSTISISENSLIKLKSVGNLDSLNVQRGYLTTTIKGSEPVLMEMNGKHFSLTGKDAKVIINFDNKKGEIGVLSGEVLIEKDKITETLTPATALEIQGDQVSKKSIYYQLLSPTHNQNIYLLNESSPVNFKWTPEFKGQMIISKTQNFKDQKIYEGTGNLEIPLTPGAYYWKVESELGNSLVGHFRIYPEAAPKIIRPLTGELIQLPNGEKNTLQLQWDTNQGNNYELEWSDGNSHLETVSGAVHLLSVEKPGKLEWRIRVKDEHRPNALWSEWQKINIQFIEAPAIPSNLSPHEIEYQSYTKEGQEVELSWDADGPVELIWVGPKGVEKKEVVESNSKKIVVFESGTYRYKVRGIDSFLRSSPWSEWKSFEFSDLSNEKNAGYQRIQLKRPDQKVEFTWVAATGSVSVFEFAKDKKFKEIVFKKDIKGNSTHVVIPKLGAYYWRSYEYFSNGKIQISEPKKVIIEPSPAPTKPLAPPSMEIPIQWKTIEHKKTTSLWRFFGDFLIASAYAEELQAVAEIKLPENENAKQFIVRIYKDEELKNLILEKTTEGTVLEWTDVTPGNYYWQYAIIDHWDRQSAFSDSSKLTVLDHGHLPKPKLLSPIRAQEIDGTEYHFKWYGTEKNTQYELQISGNDQFEEILFAHTTKELEYLVSGLQLKPQMYYWRIKAQNKTGMIFSNTGRFVIKSTSLASSDTEAGPLADEASIKNIRSRLSLAYAPSLDTYTFTKAGQTGEINGNVIVGIEAKGNLFNEKWILSGEILRQSGKVFSGESYLFQRVLTDGTIKKELNNKNLLSYGLSLGATSGIVYDIIDGRVKGTSVTSLNYGPIIRHFMVMSGRWEMQNKLTYLIGSIKQMEVESVVLRHANGFYYLGGLGYLKSSYEVSSGEQSSMRLTIGLGKEF